MPQSEQAAGRWLIWGAGASADVQASIWAGLGPALAGAVSDLQPVSLDGSPAAHTGPAAPIREQGSAASAPDCGEGDLFDDAEEGR
jgi:hypothetical protein